MGMAKLPMFNRAEMDKRIAKSGKNIENKDHHSVPTALRKAKTFLEDEYLHEIMATCDDKCFYFKAKCCHSYRKNYPPHQLKLSLCIAERDVLHSSCTCVTGKVGFLQSYFSTYVERLKIQPVQRQNNEGLTKRRGRQSPMSMYFAASAMEQERWRRKHCSPTSDGGCGEKNKT